MCNFSSTTPIRRCVEALRNGAIDAVTTDEVILAGYAARTPGEFKIVGKPFSEERYGVGLKKDDSELRAQDQRRAGEDGSRRRVERRPSREPRPGRPGYAGAAGHRQVLSRIGTGVQSVLGSNRCWAPIGTGVQSVLGRNRSRSDG